MAGRREGGIFNPFVVLFWNDIHMPVLGEKAMTNPAILEALARAIHCHDGRLPTPWDADMIARWPDDCEYQRKVAMSQAAAVLELVGPKPLVWQPYPNPVFAGPHIAVANCRSAVEQFYQVQRDPDAAGYMAFLAPKFGTLVWKTTGFDTLEAAQAAAQSHADAAHWANTKLGDML